MPPPPASVLCIASSFGRTDEVYKHCGAERFSEVYRAYEEHPIENYFAEVKNSGKPIVLCILGPLGHDAIKYLCDDYDKPAEERRVKWIHGIPTGIDWYRFPELRNEMKGMHFTTGKGAYGYALGMHAMYSILYFNRQTAKFQQNRRERKWDAFDTEEPRGKKVGIIGYGDIGRGAARLLQPLQVSVTGVTRKPPAAGVGSVDEFGVTVTCGDAERDRVIRESDYLINILPGIAETKGLFDAARFATMKPNAVYINIGRGSTQVDADLAAALLSGTIAGASLDVFEKEPLTPDSPLYDVPDDKILMTSHNACLTKTSFPAAIAIFRESAAKYLETGVIEGYQPDLEVGY